MIIEWVYELYGLIGLILINILVWVFLWGKRTGKVNTRLTNLEDRIDTHSILPECSELFSEIKGALSNVVGKVDVMLLMVKESQKNIERKRTSRTKK